MSMPSQQAQNPRVDAARGARDGWHKGDAFQSAPLNSYGRRHSPGAYVYCSLEFSTLLPGALERCGAGRPEIDHVR